MLKRRVTPLIIVMIFVAGVIITSINYRVYSAKTDSVYEQIEKQRVTYNDYPDNNEDSTKNVTEILQDKEEAEELPALTSGIYNSSGSAYSDAAEFSLDDYSEYLNSIEENYRIKWAQTDKSQLTLVKKIADSEYEVWDTELNYVYGLLKDVMDEDEFEKLKEEEIAWISSKEAHAKNSAAGYTGNTYNYMYTNALTDTTRDRTYYLLDLLTFFVDEDGHIKN